MVMCYTSTTLNWTVAHQYASGGSTPTTARMGMVISMSIVDQGADLSALFQYPQERESRFAPCTVLQVQDTAVEGSLLIVKMRANANVLAGTLDG